jgi:hypothetical protein
VTAFMCEDKTIKLKKAIAFGFLKLIIEHRGNKYAIVRHIRSRATFERRNFASPPYVTKTVDDSLPHSILEREVPERVAQLRVSSSNEIIELTKRMRALCHQLGFQGFKLVQAQDHIEHFISEDSGILGIPIIYELELRAGFPLHTLGDALGYRGFIFIPLASLKTSHAHELPLYKNVIGMLGIWSNSRVLATLKDEDFTLRGNGYICSVDISGFGKLLADSQGSVMTTKDQVQHSIRSEVVRLTSRLLRRLGFPPNQGTGDGALFCLPGALELSLLIAAYLEEVCLPLERWNQQIVDDQSPGWLSGSRLAIVQGEYHYGRIAGADSVGAGIDGQPLVDVVRLDAGFKKYLTKKQALVERRHFLVSSETISHENLGLNGCTGTFNYLPKERNKMKGKFTPIGLARLNK